MSKEQTKKELNLPKNKKIILTVGASYVKGTDFLIKSFYYFHKKNKNTILIIVGPKTSYFDKLNQLINELKLKEYVIFKGPQTHSDLIKWYNSADIYSMGSRVEYFTAPEIEAMACGIPSVACITYPKRDILDNEEIRLTLRKRDMKLFADTISNGLEKEWDTKKLIEISNKFSWENITKKVIKVYKKAIEINN